ncbi:MAG: UDP-3-O-(3-hydroxymyristoyl)glucosamine N-acyltransferase [Firmicutes bacterium]|nr:UDP-3-O-(3-hydroxymyristoyl)glucosamine N-acyltransferase [Bacillota bacterium]
MVRKLGDLAKVVGGELVGSADLVIDGVSPIAEAEPGHISFAENLKVLGKYKKITQAAALIVPKDAEDVGRPHIKVDNPRLAFAQILKEFAWPADVPPGIHPSALVHQTAELGENVTVGPGVIVGEGAKIGKGTTLMASCYIGSHTIIGEDCLIYPHVCIREQVQIGNRVIIHAGAVIGDDGFGFVSLPTGHVKMSHIGTVIIHDDVEIGTNSAVERGTCGATVIGRGTKIGNLVQVGHNVKLGEHCLVVAMSGISGSAIIGNRVTLAGQSGVAGHLTIGDNSVVAARGLVAGDLPPGSFVSGFPARPHRENMRVIAAQRKLPELMQRLKQLEQQVAALMEDDGEIWETTGDTSQDED